jgi:ribosomal protein L21E
MLQSIREKVASTSSNKERESQRKLAKTRPSPVYDVGDQVKISNRMKHKLDAKWRGPHNIVQRVLTTAYKVQLDTGERIHHLIHHAHLRPWYATDDDDAPDDPENDDDSNYDVEVEEPDDSNKYVRPEDPSVPKSEDPTPIYRARILPLSRRKIFHL